MEDGGEPSFYDEEEEKTMAIFLINKLKNPNTKSRFGNKNRLKEGHLEERSPFRAAT